MPPSNQVKKVVKGQQYRPEGNTGTTPATVVNVPPPAMLPKTGK